MQIGLKAVLTISSALLDVENNIGLTRLHLAQTCNKLTKASRQINILDKIGALPLAGALRAAWFYNSAHKGLCKVLLLYFIYVHVNRS